MPVYYPAGEGSPAFHSLLCKLMDAWRTPIEINATDNCSQYFVPGPGALCQHAPTMGGLTIAFQQRIDALQDTQRNYGPSKRQWPGLTEQQVHGLFRFVETTGFMVPTAWPERGTVIRFPLPPVVQYVFRLDLVKESACFGVTNPNGERVWSRDLGVNTHGGLVAYTTRTLQAQRDTLLMTLGQQETIG